MDEVIIEGLSLKAVIGVHDWERAFAQRLAADVVMAVDTSAPAASDALGDAVDYAAIADRLRTVAEASECLLDRAARRAAGRGRARGGSR